MIRIAGVVIIFNPSLKYIDNIASYANQVETLFVIDNSEIINSAFVEKVKLFNDVVYKWNEGNLGIAKALNIGAQLAIEYRYDFLLMMDQDSSLSNNAQSEFIKYISNHPNNDIGILYSLHVYKNYHIQNEEVFSKELLVADTSGALLNLSAYNTIGPFMEKLFIDYVDFEYCLRLRLNGFKIIQLNSIMLYQELGHMIEKKVLFLKIGITNHSPQRIYYRVRNRLFVSSKYLIQFPIWSIKQIAYIWIEFGKVIFFEDNKILKCRMIIRGVNHFVTNNYRIFSLPE